VSDGITDHAVDPRAAGQLIRDAALAASGLLSREIGGPGVYPPQPQGIYRFTQQVKYWKESGGDDRYRRGMYTYFWRSSPYPFLMTFDAPDANTACTRRPRSNTPLQSLTLANDRAFYEMAGALGIALLRTPADNDAQRVAVAFRRCLARAPTTHELTGLVDYVAAERRAFAAAPAEAAKVVSPNPPASVDTAELAAWAMVARVMLNLDEFITRE
jgi:hypothetical protein